MKRFYIHIFRVLIVLAVMLMHGSCVEQLDEVLLLETDNVSFKASLDGGEHALLSKGMVGSLNFEEEEWMLENETATKAGLLNSLNGLDAGVYGYVYSGAWNPAVCSPLEMIDGDLYTFDGDMLKASVPVRWSVIEAEAEDGYNFRAFVYAPKDKVTPVYQTPATGDSDPMGAPVIQIPNIFQAGYQNDIIVADASFPMNYSTKAHRKEIQLDFEHIFTAIQFKAGFDCTITGVSITDIKAGGNYVIGSGWSLSSGSATYSMTLPTGGLSVSKGGDIGGILLMIPQEITSDNARLSLTYMENGTSKTVTAKLKGVEWKQGKKITYTLMRESDREYVYLDLAAGDIKITGKTYSGYVFVNKEAKPVAGTIGSNQKYYIYQSCTQNVSSPNYKLGFTEYDSTKKQAGGTFTKPSYDVVTYNDMLWSDYITDNDNVENVINAWDNKSGATDNTGIDVKKAVRKVGRESTKYFIDIRGTVGMCTMIIDNIYCSNQHQGQNRTWGSIGFIPTYNTNSTLVLNLVGDNRIGCLHYDNNLSNASKGSNEERKRNTNFLKIEGEGSLTVADADFYVANSGFYSNHYDSAIGNSDSRNSTYGIIINSGTIFAGTTRAENSSAIGAGGNGYGEVIINGGVVTAVASTTGTAIGGGIGYSDTGGKGYVEINGGNVYAYNHKNVSTTPIIPSSAIGGAGSRDQAGSEGIVLITGGNVYAQSALGTAIGGGSSATKPGGYGDVTITGGVVIAKSLSEISAGIGGGSTCTGGGSLTAPNGGNAIIRIGVEDDPSKNPIVRTGSIGGGGTNATGGTVGNAQIYVYGGDIQAQFVMAQSDGNIFDMQDGMVRNSSTSDDTYYCIKPHGAAVYMEKGTFTMSGGTIKECYADKTADSKGGAVYIKGDEGTSFTMTGGEIRECSAKADGGAVYLEGGSVNVEGGRIYGNVAYNGNGGAISIVGGNFTMNGESAYIIENAAFDGGSGTKGNGGGIYIAPESSTSSAAIAVNLQNGNITGNSSDRNGGGVCVDMGGNVYATLSVAVGNESDGANMKIDSNNTLNKGGGMYVNSSAKSTVTLFDGYIFDNGTSSYRVNQDITVDGGLVTLMKPGITTQVTVTFSDNAQYYTQGDVSDMTGVQYVVAASNSRLNKNVFTQINDYYNSFVGWNTKRDGSGVHYEDEALDSFDEDITLYAQWE